MTPKTTNILIGSAVGLGILYFLVSNADATDGGSSDPTGNGTGNPDGSSGFNAKTVADDLLEAMRYLGTDEDTVIGILKYVNPTQFNAVFTAFGSHQYNATLGNQQNPTAWIDELPFVNLKGWLKSELSEAEYLNLKRKYPTKL